MTAFPHRFHTLDEAEAFAASKEGNYALHIGYYSYNVKGGFFFVTEHMTTFNDERCKHLSSI